MPAQSAADPPVRARSARSALLIAYAVAMLLLGGSAIIDYRNARDLEVSGSNVSTTLEAMEKLRQIGNTFFIAESSQRGYILTGSALYLASYRDMQQRVPERLAEVGELVSNTAAQQASVGKLRVLATQKFDEMNRTLDVLATQGREAAMDIFSKDDAIHSMTSVRELIRVMLVEETRLLTERRGMAARAYSGSQWRALIATCMVALALTAFYLLMRRFLRQRDAALAVVEASNAELEKRVVDRTADLANLSRHLLNVREHEKKIIARDLHDEFGSYLTAINMDVSRARDKIAATNPEQAAKLERTLTLLGSAIEMKRQLISDLRPSMLDNLGLGAALEQYIDEWSRRTGIAATFDHSGTFDTSDEGAPIAIFRVFQEALINVAKHADATRVAAYAYRVGDAIEFEIADDGVGLSEPERFKSGTHGLLGTRERVHAFRGHVEFLRGANGGTIVRGSIPYELAATQARADSLDMHFV
ncbi:MAG: CHASE3 domain-containing protein [Burkholderiaceae bacterium]